MREVSVLKDLKISSVISAWGGATVKPGGGSLDVLSAPLPGSLDVNYKVLKLFGSSKRHNT